MQKINGIAASLILPIFLGTSFDLKDIQYDSETESFVNIRLDKVFEKMWNNTTASNKYPYRSPFVPMLNLNDLLSQFQMSLEDKALLQDLLQNKKFILESNLTVLRAITVPFDLMKPQCKSSCGETVFDYLKKRQFYFLCHAILDKNFRNFISNCRQHREPLLVDLLTITYKGKNVFQDKEALDKALTENFSKFSTPEALVQFFLMQLRDLPNKYSLLQFTARSLDKQSTDDPLANLFLNEIVKFVGLEEKQENEPAQHLEIRTNLRKEILKDILLNKIQRQNTLAGVFQIVKDSKTENAYALLRNREGPSLKAPGIKNETGDILSVGKRFAFVLHAAKTRMYEIALANKKGTDAFSKENNVNSITNNEEYWNFILTNINGYYFNLESPLEYIKLPSTAEKLLALKHAVENSHFLSEIKDEMVDCVIEGLKKIPVDIWDGIQNIGSSVVFAMVEGIGNISDNAQSALPEFQTTLATAGQMLQNGLSAIQSMLPNSFLGDSDENSSTLERSHSRLDP